MNTKLMMAAVSVLLFAQGAIAYSWKVHNYTPFEIQAKFDVVGRDHTMTIASGETKEYNSGGKLVRGVKIFGIKTLIGNTYFGSDSTAPILTDSWGPGKAFGTTWSVFLENQMDAKVSMRGTSGTFSFTPTQQRFILVRANFGAQDYRLLESVWYDLNGSIKQDSGNILNTRRDRR